VLRWHDRNCYGHLFFFFGREGVMLAIEPRTLLMLGTCSTTELHLCPPRSYSRKLASSWPGNPEEPGPQLGA
jgi:hypothetical protein